LIHIVTESRTLPPLSSVDILGVPATPSGTGAWFIFCSMLLFY